MCESEDTGELKSFEARLASLMPRDDRLDRERLMFLMGRAAERAAGEPSPGPSLNGRGSVWAWPAAFGAIAASLMCVLIMRPSNSGLERSGDAAIRTVEQSATSPRLDAVRDHGTEVLVVRDVYSGDIEARMARLSVANDGAESPNHEAERSALTPNDWRSVFNPSTSLEESGGGSSAISYSRRVQA